MRAHFAGYDPTESPIRAFPFKHDEPAPRPAVDLVDGCSWKVIVRLVAMKHGLRVSDIIGRSRKKHIVAARDEAIWLVRSHTTFSLPAIGRLFDGRHHTTILDCLQKRAP